MPQPQPLSLSAQSSAPALALEDSLDVHDSARVAEPTYQIPSPVDYDQWDNHVESYIQPRGGSPTYDFDEDEELELMARREMEEAMVDVANSRPAALRRVPSGAPKPPLSTRPPAGRRLPHRSAATVQRAPSVPSRPASVSTERSSTPRGAYARPMPGVGMQQQPLVAPKVPRGKSREHGESFEQKLEKRDMLVNCILNNEVPNRSVTPRRRQQPSTPRAALRPSNQGARMPTKVGRSSQCRLPDDVDARHFTSVAAKSRPAHVEEALRFGGDDAEWKMERVAPLTLPSLRVGAKLPMRSHGQRLQNAVAPMSGSQSARGWRKNYVGL